MEQPFSSPHAVAYVKGGPNAPSLLGTVTFYQMPEGVLVTARVSGLPHPSGFFALHIHEGTICSGQAFTATGGHYNPTRASHPNHAGDLPPLLSYQGNSYLSVITDRFTVHDVIGRTVVIHGEPDDFRSQPAGNAGAKIACGVISAS